MNSTHLKIEWDKPFAHQKYDVRSYTFLILNSSSDNTLIRKIVSVSHDTNYPIIYYFNYGGVIPRDCIIFNFTLTATNDAGSSNPGYVTGGFAIGNG